MFTVKMKSDVDADINIVSLAISFRYEVYTQAFHIMWIREQAFDFIIQELSKILIHALKTLMYYGGSLKNVEYTFQMFVKV